MMSPLASCCNSHCVFGTPPPLIRFRPPLSLAVLVRKSETEPPADTPAPGEANPPAEAGSVTGKTLRMVVFARRMVVFALSMVVFALRTMV